MNKISYIIVFLVAAAFVALILKKSKEQQDRLFKQAVDRAAAETKARDNEREQYNQHLQDLQNQFNEQLTALHERNLALTALVRKHAPADVLAGL
jgi:ABC-type transporter MlaC component